MRENFLGSHDQNWSFESITIILRDKTKSGSLHVHHPQSSQLWDRTFLYRKFWRKLKHLNRTSLGQFWSQRPYNAWFNFTGYHPTRATPGTSPALRARRWGIVRSGPVPGVGDWGKSKITSLWFLLSTCYFSRVLNEAAEFKTTYIQEGKTQEFAGERLERNNLLKSESVFEGMF